MKKLWPGLIPLLILSPFLYIGIFIDHEWLRYLGISILLCSPAIVAGLAFAYPTLFERLGDKLFFRKGNNKEKK